MKLTRRGFITAAAVLPFVPALLPDAVKVTVSARSAGINIVHPDVLKHLEVPPLTQVVQAMREVSLFKGRAVGATTIPPDVIAALWREELS